MIKCKLLLELWKNDTEGECCQRKDLHLIKPNIFLWKPRKIAKIVSVKCIYCFSVFILSGCYFSLSTNKIDILTMNALQSPTTWLYIFLNFITTLKCLIIWFIRFLNGFKSNVYSMHCSFDKPNYFQLYLHNLALLLFAQQLFLQFFTSIFQLMWLWYMTDAEK